MKNDNIVAASDIKKVNEISIIPTILEVICRTTGMGFAAVARVTDKQWIACSVLDEIGFGLKPGGELELETTICNEIRQTRQAVVIDHVKHDALFCNHHTPRMYGFQSYISVPIFLKSGEFFGTLCAIDPRPAEVNNKKIIGMFNLFAELISFHLQAIDQLEEVNARSEELEKDLQIPVDENRQYQFISDHNLQEPLRKMRFYSSALMNSTENNDQQRVQSLASKVNEQAQRFSMMIKDLSVFSNLVYEPSAFEVVDLNKVVHDVSIQLQDQLESTHTSLIVGILPSVKGIQIYLEQFFFHLITNAIKFRRDNVSPVIKISSIAHHLAGDSSSPEKEFTYFEIYVEDNGNGIDRSQLDGVFDIISSLNYEKESVGFGIGLAYCKKIARIHGGSITAESTPGYGSKFIITLPYERATQRNGKAGIILK